MAYGWTKLETKATTDGQTSVSWSLVQPVADGSNGVVMVTRNGIAALPDEVTVSGDGASITYTPADAFVADENAWGWYVSAIAGVAPSGTEAGILQAALDVMRRRLGLDTDEWPDSALYAECKAVLMLYMSQFAVLSDLSTLTANDVTVMGLVVGLSAAARMMSGIVFSRSGGATSIKGRETSVTYGSGGGGMTASTFRDEAENYFGMLSGIRSQRADFAAAHSPYRIGGRQSTYPRPVALFWRDIFDDMFYLAYPSGFLMDGYPL